jgi:hypothetical protein
MKSIITELVDLIKAEIPEFFAVGVWNNQLQAMADGVGYEVPMPSLFVELQNPNNVQQLGMGVQLYELYVVIHICHANYNNVGDMIDADLEIFDLKQKVFELIQRVELTKCCELVRIAEDTDINHDTVVHYIQTYTTNFTDFSKQRYQKQFTTLPTGLNIEING